MLRMSISQALALAEEHFHEGRANEAVAVCKTLLEAAPEEPARYRILGTMAIVAKKLPLAEGMLRRALAIDPGFVEAEAELARVLLMQGRTAEAEAYFRRIADARPDDADASLNLAAVLHRQGKFAEAEVVAHRAIALRPDIPRAANVLGNALEGQGRFEEAEAIYRRAWT